MVYGLWFAQFMNPFLGQLYHDTYCIILCKNLHSSGLPKVLENHLIFLPFVKLCVICHQYSQQQDHYCHQDLCNGPTFLYLLACYPNINSTRLHALLNVCCRQTRIFKPHKCPLSIPVDMDFAPRCDCPFCGFFSEHATRKEDFGVFFGTGSRG